MHTIYFEPEFDQRNLARFAGRQQTTDLVCFGLARAEGAVFAFERLIAGSADTDVALLKFQATDHAIETVLRSGLAQTPPVPSAAPDNDLTWSAVPTPPPSTF
jgi:hypothetical protein